MRFNFLAARFHELTISFYEWALWGSSWHRIWTKIYGCLYLDLFEVSEWFLWISIQSLRKGQLIIFWALGRLHIVIVSWLFAGGCCHCFTICLHRRSSKLCPFFYFLAIFSWGNLTYLALHSHPTRWVLLGEYSEVIFISWKDGWLSYVQW